MKALDQDWADSNGTVCVITEETSFSRKRNLKYVSTQMKALDEYIQESHILMVLFALLLKRVHFLVEETWICDHSNESSLDEYILMVLFVLLLERVHFLVNET